MLATAIKNFVIVALLLLILHFLIKNALVERFPVGAPLALSPSPRVRASDPAPAPEGPSTVASTKPSTADPDDAKELFEWAYKEEASRPACTPNHLDVADIFKKSEKRGHAPNQQRLKDAVVINEYSDEKVMNGGPLFAGLHGYDGADSKWSSVDGTGAPLLPGRPLRPCGANK